MNEYLTIKEKIDFVNDLIKHNNFNINYMQNAINDENLDELSMAVALEKLSILLNQKNILSSELRLLTKN